MNWFTDTLSSARDKFNETMADHPAKWWRWLSVSGATFSISWLMSTFSRTSTTTGISSDVSTLSGTSFAWVNIEKQLSASGLDTSFLTVTNNDAFTDGRHHALSHAWNLCKDRLGDACDEAYRQVFESIDSTWSPGQLLTSTVTLGYTGWQIASMVIGVPAFAAGCYCLYRLHQEWQTSEAAKLGASLISKA